jgi:hypothetical protein
MMIVYEAHNILYQHIFFSHECQYEIQQIKI